MYNNIGQSKLYDKEDFHKCGIICGQWSAKFSGMQNAICEDYLNTAKAEGDKQIQSHVWTFTLSTFHWFEKWENLNCMDL